MDFLIAIKISWDFTTLVLEQCGMMTINANTCMSYLHHYCIKGTIEIVKLDLQAQATHPEAVLCSKLPLKFHFIASFKILW